MHVNDSPLIISSTCSLPFGVPGLPYADYAFTASGGSAPITWQTTGLPEGLTLSSNGKLSGTPIGSGFTTFVVTAKDSSPTPQTASLSCVIGIVTKSPAFALKELVANTAGTTATTVDPNLADPWGVAFASGADGSVANNRTSTSTEYDGTGVPQLVGSPLGILLPAGTGGRAFQPTGMVANSTPEFIVGSGVTAGPAQFIYAGASGMIAAWAPIMESSTAATTYVDGDGAVYTGLALANNGAGNFLYAADFHGRKIDVFDASFNKQAPSPASFSFADPSLPASYAPFGILAINNGSGGTAQLYVAYAEPLGTDGTPATGQGLGLVNVFDANGGLIRHLVNGGALNAPWGLALAPTDFGTLSQTLLVGNSGDGKINAFDAVTGAIRGTLSDVNHNPLSVPGLHGIAFGNGYAGQAYNALFFAAGPNSTDGIYGRIDPLNSISVGIRFVNSCFGSPFPGCMPNLIVVANVSHALPIEVQFFINGSLVRTATQPPFELQTSPPQGNADVTVTVTDIAGDVATTCRRFVGPRGFGFGAACGG